MLRDLTPRKAIEFAVKTEESGAIFYRKMARRLADDKEIYDVFMQLAEDEDHHKAQFEALMEKVPSSRGAPGLWYPRNMTTILIWTAEIP